jgi:hypothetical protein
MHILVSSSSKDMGFEPFKTRKKRRKEEEEGIHYNV